MERDPLICPQCLNRYDDSTRVPYLRSCGHSFCDICRRESDACPECGHERQGQDRINFQALDGIRGLQPRQYSEVSPRRYQNLNKRVKRHEFCLGIIERRIKVCSTKLQRIPVQSHRKIIAKIEEMCTCILTNFNNRRNTINQDIVSNSTEINELRNFAANFLQNQAANPDRNIITAEQALDLMRMKELPTFDTNLRYSFDGDAVTQLHAKLIELFEEIRNCKRDFRISAERVGEDRYVVTIDDQQLIFRVREGLLTLLPDNPIQYVNQRPANQPEPGNINRELDMNPEQNLVEIEQAVEEHKLPDDIIGPNISPQAQVQDLSRAIPEEEFKIGSRMEHALPDRMKNSLISQNIAPENPIRQIYLVEDSSEEEQEDYDDLEDFIEHDAEFEEFDSDGEWRPQTESESEAESQARNNSTPPRFRRLRKEGECIFDSITKRFRTS